MNDERTRIVMFSGGVTSWAAAVRCIEKYGRDNVVLAFADTMTENDDLYAFVAKATEQLDVPLHTIRDGRNVWEVFRDVRFLGNTRIDPCSRVLKRDALRTWLHDNFTPETGVVVLGMDWTEGDRIAKTAKYWDPWTVEFPLNEPPYVDKEEWLRLAAEADLPRNKLYEIGMQHANCFHPDTRFITADGVKSLRDCLGKTVQVLGRSQGWHEAEVRSFGEQPLMNLRLRRYSDEKDLLVTPEHLWPVRKRASRKEYRWVETSALKPGDRIAGMYTELQYNVRPSPIGVMAGFTFGDGDASNYSSGQIPPARAHMCSEEKTQALSPYFATCRMKTDDRGVTSVQDLPRSWKELPDLSESKSYLYGWLSGYFAADGSVSSGQAVISSARLKHIEFVRDVCTRLGLSTNPIRTQMRRGYGSEDTPLHSTALVMSTLREDFFILEKHRRGFVKRQNSAYRPADWQVDSVHDTGRIEEVMCAVVPDGEVFTLEDNVLTHNCAGFCIKAGQGQFAKLLEHLPEVYDYHEQEEQSLRTFLGKDIAILRDRRGGTTKPMTMKTFRERIQGTKDDPSCDLPYDPLDVGGCGCMTPEEDEPYAEIDALLEIARGTVPA